MPERDLRIHVSPARTPDFPVTFSEKDSLQEKCGVFLFWSSRPTSKLERTLLGMGGVQHRGQHGAGFVSLSKDGVLHQGYGNGDIRSALSSIHPNDVIGLSYPSLWSMGQCRYSTFGDQQSANLQPCVEETLNDEEVVVSANGEFTFTLPIPTNGNGELSDTRIFTRLLAQSPEKTPEEKILKTLDSGVTGAYSMTIAIGRDVFVIRDKGGIRPLHYGEHDGGIMVASETIALDIAGAENIEEVPRGVLFKLTKHGLKEVGKSKEAQVESIPHFCLFEFAYFSRPDSRYVINVKEVSVQQIRAQHGRILAQEHPFPDAHFVTGVPDSGRFVAQGYGEQMMLDGHKVPYRDKIIRDHFHQKEGVKRSFQADIDIDRFKVIAGKTSLIRDSDWEDAIVVIGNDSNVRGNDAKKQTERAFEAGAKEVHWVFGFPQVLYTCHFGVNIKDRDSLIAARNDGDNEKIAREIGATSVSYISDEGFVRGIYGDDIVIPDNPLEIFLVNGGCGGCLTGVYPVDQEGNIWQSPEIRAAAKIG